MKKVAVFGSRRGIEPLDVGNEIARLMGKHGDFIVVTTEAVGVCEAARVAALAAGLPVIRFAPVKLQGGGPVEDIYGVEEWRLHRGASTVVRHEDPNWSDWQSACNWRSLLMVDRATHGLAFHHGGSRGTQFEIELFGMQRKPCKVIRS